MIRTLIIPVDPGSPATVRAVTPDAISVQLTAVLSDLPEACYYDRDAITYVGGNSAFTAAVNPRVTEHAATSCDAAVARRHAGDVRPLGYAVHGPVVIVGRGADGEIADVPDRLVELFGGRP